MYSAYEHYYQMKNEIYQTFFEILFFNATKTRLLGVKNCSTSKSLCIVK